MQFCETNEALGQSHDSYSTVLDPIIMNKLQGEIKKNVITRSSIMYDK